MLLTKQQQLCFYATQSQSGGGCILAQEKNKIIAQESSRELQGLQKYKQICGTKKIA